jgi:hypothetical protein
MSPKVVLRLLAVLLATSSVYCVGVFAQDDASSVADAARQARRQKQDAAKPAHVIDNDAIPSSSAASNSANPANTPADAKASQAANSSAQPASGSADEANNKDEADALKKEIAAKKGQVDFQKREMALAQDNYYSNPDHDRDTAGKQKLDAMQADLTQAQSELDELQAKLAKTGAAAEEKPAEPAKP